MSLSLASATPLSPLSSPTPGHCLPPRPATCPSPTLRRRVVPRPNPPLSLPSHPRTFPTSPFRCSSSMSVESASTASQVIEKFHHIRDYLAFKAPPALDIKTLLKCQLAVAVLNRWARHLGLLAGFSSQANSALRKVARLPGVLDELFSYNGPLGALFLEESVSLYLCVATAQAVRACIYQDPSGGDPLETVQLEEVNGAWSTKGPKRWEGCFYVYEVSVYHPSTLRIEKCYANDPYARGFTGCLSLPTITEYC